MYTKLEKRMDDDEPQQYSRRPREISPDVWDNMQESEKMEAIKKYNPDLYTMLMEQEDDDDEEEYVSRRPPQVDEDTWYGSTEEQKEVLIEKYANKLSTTSSVQPIRLPPSLQTINNPVKEPPKGLTAPFKPSHPTIPSIVDKPQEKSASQMIQVRVPSSIPRPKEPTINEVKRIEKSLVTKQDIPSEDEEEEPQSVFKLDNLVALLSKHNVTIHSLYTVKKRVKFLLLVIQNFYMGIYMSSKYTMYISKLTGFETFSLEDDEEDNDQDTMFYQRLPIEGVRREKHSKCRSLLRFSPLVSESPIKLMYLGRHFLGYITRDNKVESYVINNPVYKTGFYYMTDLEYLFKNLKDGKIMDDLQRFEKAFCDASFDRLQVEITNSKENVMKIFKTVQSMKPAVEKKTFFEKVAKLNKYVKVDKHKEKANGMLAQIRQDNLDTIFTIENVTFALKELK